jgi:hypothetical protein
MIIFVAVYLIVLVILGATGITGQNGLWNGILLLSLAMNMGLCYHFIRLESELREAKKPDPEPEEEPCEIEEEDTETEDDGGEPVPVPLRGIASLYTVLDIAPPGMMGASDVAPIQPGEILTRPPVISQSLADIWTPRVPKTMMGMSLRNMNVTTGPDEEKAEEPEVTEKRKPNRWDIH